MRTFGPERFEVTVEKSFSDFVICISALKRSHREDYTGGASGLRRAWFWPDIRNQRCPFGMGSDVVGRTVLM
jgi:hypothetical protein